MICGNRFHDDEGLEMTSSDAARITHNYQYLEEKVHVLNTSGTTCRKVREKFRALSQRLLKFKALCVRGILASSDESRFSVSHFSDLEYLQLDKCPLHSIIGSFYQYREKLKILDISNSEGLILSRIFLPWRYDMKLFDPINFPPMTPRFDKRHTPDQKLCWLSLSKLRITMCGLTALDVSLHFLPSVTSVDFSHNNLSEIIHFQDCCKLTDLDLSYNRIQVLCNLSRVLGNISYLNLAHNQIRSLNGIEKLNTLKSLNVSDNLIDNFEEIKYLSKLPCLESLHLLNNPISQPPTKEGLGQSDILVESIAVVVYRVLVFRQLLPNGVISGTGKALPMLDDKPMSTAQKESFK